MNFSISDEHGEPTNFGVFFSILLILGFWFMWSVGENGFWKTIKEFFFF